MKNVRLGILAVILTICGATLLSGCASSKHIISNTRHPSSNTQFVMLAEAVPDAILEIRYYSTYNFVGARVDGYEQPTAMLTKEAAEALRAVSDDVMSQGYRLKIYDAYRPQKAVDHFVRWAADLGDTKMKTYFYPDLDKSVLFEQEYIMVRARVYHGEERTHKRLYG